MQSRPGLVLDLARMTDAERYAGNREAWGSNPVLTWDPLETPMQLRTWSRISYLVVRWGDPRTDDFLDLVNERKPLAQVEVYAIVGDHLCQFTPLISLGRPDSGTELAWDASVAGEVFNHLNLEQRANPIYGFSQRYRWIYHGAHPVRRSFAERRK